MTRASGRAVAVVFGLSVAAIPCVARPANADDPKGEAAKSFRAGSEAYARGDFRNAARAFDDAYRIAPRAAAVYNAGLSWEGAGERLRAADDYTQALEASDLGTAERADATGRLRALERALARVAVVAPPGSRFTLDDVDEPAGRTTFHVEPGKHVLNAVLPEGKEDGRTLFARAGATETVRLGDVREPDTRGAGNDDAPGRRDASDGPQRSRDGSSQPALWPAWVAFGAAGVASAVAIGAYFEGLSARNQFEKGNEVDRGLRNEALSLRTATWVSWALAGGCAATGVVLYLSPPTSSTASGRAGGPSLAVSLHGVSIQAPF